MLFFLSLLSIPVIGILLLIIKQGQYEKKKFTILFGTTLVLLGFIYDIFFWNYGSRVVDFNTIIKTTEICSTIVTTINATTSSTDSTCSKTEIKEVANETDVLTYYALLNKAGSNIFFIFNVFYIIMIIAFILSFGFTWLSELGLIKSW